jgi:hypothetical protein
MNRRIPMKKTVAAVVLAVSVLFLAYRRAVAQSAPATTRPVSSFSQGYNNGDDNNNQWNQRRDRRRREEGNNNNFRSSTSRPAQMTDRYGVLTERSIFYKGRFVPLPPGGTVEAAPPPPAQNITFNGLAATDYDHGNTVGVWLENIDTESVQEVHVGDIVQGGHITKIDVVNNTLDYTINGRTRTVTIGQTLAGEQVFGVNAGPSSGPADSSVDMSGPNADILKRLMARRQAELNGGK